MQLLPQPHPTSDNAFHRRNYDQRLNFTTRITWNNHCSEMEKNQKNHYLGDQDRILRIVFTQLRLGFSIPALPSGRS